MGTVKKVNVRLPITREEFDGLYAMWKMGADYKDIANARGIAPAALAWCFAIWCGKPADLVHFKDPD